MAEMIRPRPVEHYNPRPLILGICFFWGIAMGFALFYFSPPKTTEPIPNDPDRIMVDPPPTPPLEDRRREGLPTIADVNTNQVAAPKRGFESLDLDPPAYAITTDTGLTGKLAGPIGPSTGIPVAIPGTHDPMTPTAPTPNQPPPQMLPPPLPDLMP